MLCNLFIELKTVLCVKCDYYVFYKHAPKYLDLFKKLNSLSNQLVQLIIEADSTDTVYTVYILNVYQVLLCSYFFIQILTFIPIFYVFFCFFTQSSCPDNKLSLSPWPLSPALHSLLLY